VLYEAYARGAKPHLADELPLGYGDFAAFERRWLDPTGRRYREEVAWWSRLLEREHSPLVLPFVRGRWRRLLRRGRALMGPPSDPLGRPDELTKSDGVIWWGLPPEVSGELDRLGRDAGATYFMVRLAAFTAGLALETGREDLVIGTGVTSRRLAELRWMLGDFTNTAALRLSFSGDPSFRQWLAQIRAAVLEMSAHAEVPHEQLMEALERSGVTPPELRVSFAMSHQLPPLRMAGLEIAPLRARLQLVPPGFTFMVDQWYEAERCQVYFDPRHYEASGVRSFVARFQRFAGELCKHPDASLRQTFKAARLL
jgi:hypothetical protein